jgi:glycosyltransferase involved in cell wall biosynthesis
MAAAEAMAHGCVPILLNKGGYKETVEQGKSGFLFDNEEEAIEKLTLLIQNEKLRKEISRNAAERAKKFSLERMRKEIDAAIEETIKKQA